MVPAALRSTSTLVAALVISAAAAGATIWLTSDDAVSPAEATSPAQETTATATANVSPEHVPFTTCGENCTHSQPPAAP